MPMKLKQLLSAAILAAFSLLSSRPAAALSVGDAAPDFKAPSTLDGKVVQFSLKEALAKNAVVLYFFPKAFTSG
jgi:thioredoxin-dependent peroxiredoxin